MMESLELITEQLQAIQESMEMIVRRLSVISAAVFLYLGACFYNAMTD